MVNVLFLFWRSHFSHLAVLWCSLYFWCNSDSRKSGSSHSKVCSAEICSSAATARSWKLIHAELDHWIFWDSLRACQETNSNPEMQSIKTLQGTFLITCIKQFTKNWPNSGFSVFVCPCEEFSVCSLAEQQNCPSRYDTALLIVYEVLGANERHFRWLLKNESVTALRLDPKYGIGCVCERLFWGHMVSCSAPPSFSGNKHVPVP